MASTQDKEPLLNEQQQSSGAVQPAAPADKGALLKYGSLAFLILQNSSHVLLLRYSRVLPGECSQYVVRFPLSNTETCQTCLL